MTKLLALRISLASGVLAMLLGSAAVLPVEAASERHWRGSELALSVSQQGAVQPWQRGRARASGSGTFVSPTARPQSDRRPSHYYVPPPRTPVPFYHYERHAPSPPAHHHQRHTGQFRH